MTIITNIIAYTNTWNHTVWFVLPFALVMLTYSFWMKFLDTRVGIVSIVIVSFFAYYAVALIYGRWYDDLKIHRYLLHCCRFIELLTPFAFGAVAQRLSSTKLPKEITPTILHVMSLLLAILSFLYSTFHGMPFYPVYCALFMILLANVKYNKYLKKMLKEFGKYSMIIWLTHIYYFEVLFKEQIFSLKYPLPIFIMVAIISLLVALLLDRIISPIINKIR